MRWVSLCTNFYYVTFSHITLKCAKIVLFLNMKLMLFKKKEILMEQHKLASTSKLAQTCRFSAHVVLQDSWFKPLKKISVDDKILLVFVKEEGGGILFEKFQHF